MGTDVDRSLKSGKGSVGFVRRKRWPSARISANAGVVQQRRRWWPKAKSLRINKSCNAGVARSGLQNRGLQVRVLPGLLEDEGSSRVASLHTLHFVETTSGSATNSVRPVLDAPSVERSRSLGGSPICPCFWGGALRACDSCSSLSVTYPPGRSLAERHPAGGP